MPDDDCTGTEADHYGARDRRDGRRGRPYVETGRCAHGPPEPTMAESSAGRPDARQDRRPVREDEDHRPDGPAGPAPERGGSAAGVRAAVPGGPRRSEEHTSELQSP